ncbi:phospholipid/cholesterol/gamma-HCH transport system permease protein [Gammaproteobacteria bacterium]
MQLIPEIARSLPTLRLIPVRAVLLRQIHFSGIECLPLVMVLGVIVGWLIVFEVASLVGQNVALAVRMLTWMTLRELGPLLVALIVVARSCSAVTSELAAMRVHGEVDALERMGISPIAYLIMPRLLGMVTALLALIITFDIIALTTGLVVVQVTHDVGWDTELSLFLQIANLGDIYISFFKSLTFGVLMGVISCHHGLAVSGALADIPRAVSRAVVTCLANVFVWDVLLTVIGG